MPDMTLSKDAFNTVNSLLVSDLDFREKFFADPESALREKDIHLSDADLQSVKSIMFSKNLHVGRGFNDGLVLCSSSGY
jgi:hypothetical protein